MKVFSLIYSYLKKVFFRISHWETWHWIVKYLPMIPVWVWYCFRARSWWFFTASNPTLTFGGFEGENKKEMYAQLPTGSFPKTFFISPSRSFALIEDLAARLGFPVAVKPDVGTMGLMFRKINSLQELREYHRRMQADYILQEFCHYPIEVSVFYYRFPGQEKGTITGFVKKEYLSVTGDGKSTLFELMQAYPRVQFRMKEMRVKHAEKLDIIIEDGEVYVLCDALNLSRGGRLVSLEHEKDERLLDVFDKLSHYSGQFYFGRYDVKCASIEDLKNGKNYSILEFNGAGAEPHHVYGNGNNVIQAIKILLDHWHILFKISMANHQRGIPFWNFNRGIVHLKKSKEHFSMLKRLESNHQTILHPGKQKQLKPEIEINTLNHYRTTSTISKINAN
jgi:hypothetical protein